METVETQRDTTLDNQLWVTLFEQGWRGRSPEVPTSLRTLQQQNILFQIFPFLPWEIPSNENSVCLISGSLNFLLRGPLIFNNAEKLR